MNIQGILTLLQSLSVLAWLPGSLTGRPVGRQYQLPSLSQLQKTSLVLSSMQYEVLENSLSNEEFYLEATLSPTAIPIQKQSHIFKSVSISIKGSRDAHQNWRIQLVLHTGHSGALFPADRLKYSELILEEITLALGWQAFWIIECPPPPTSLAA